MVALTSPAFIVCWTLARSRPISSATAKRALAVDLARSPSMASWKSKYLSGASDVDGDADLRRFDRAVAEDRELLHHDAQVLVVGDELLHVGLRAPAIGAVVVEELDQGHVALRDCRRRSRARNRRGAPCSR